MPRALATLVLFLGIPAVLVAQTQKGSWSDLNGLKAGQGIEVVESNMKSHNGQFVAVTDELLSLKEQGSDVSLKRGDVVRVSTSSGAKRGAHAVIGLVIGAAIGAGIGAAAGSSHGFLGGTSRGITALVGLVIGAPSGAAVGAWSLDPCPHHHLPNRPRRGAIGAVGYVRAIVGLPICAMAGCLRQAI